MQLAVTRQSRSGEPLYRRIVDNIRDRIAKGEILPGDQLLTIAEMCRVYGVSRITADRAVRELKGLGVVETFRGRGTFVKGSRAIDPARKPPEKVSRITVLWAGDPFESAGFAASIWNGIGDEARERKLQLGMEYLPHDLTEIGTAPFSPEDGQGIIVLGAVLSLFEFSILESSGVRAVLVDAACVGAPCVLTDNHEGMRLMLHHLMGRGHRDIAFCAGFSTSYNSTNENERLEAYLRVSKERGLKPRVIDTGRYDDLFDAAASEDYPTVFVFPQDYAALTLMRLARARGVKIPYSFAVTGFDDYPRQSEEEGLTTVRVDCNAMGRAAVRALLEPPPSQAALKWVRVPPKLVARATTAWQ